MLLRLWAEIALVLRTKNKDPGNTEPLERGIKSGELGAEMGEKHCSQIQNAGVERVGSRHKRKRWRKQKSHQLLSSADQDEVLLE